MSTDLTWQTVTDSLEGTLALASTVGKRLHGGEIIELRSDLGGGKTAFTRGLADGLGSHDAVRSPSFTLGNQYRAKNGLTLYHFDFYRLRDAGILREQLAELMDDPQAVLVIEWGEIVADVLPHHRLSVGIRATGEQSREFTFTLPSTMRYLLPKEDS